MGNLAVMQQQFGKRAVPEPLAKLVAFAEGCDGFFARGFEFGDFQDQAMLKTYSEAPEFLTHLLEFAQADGTGSNYAFWAEPSADMNQAPIVVFGGEGGVHVVAGSIVDLLRLLTLDAEPMVDWDEVTYYKDESDRPSRLHSQYLAWVEQHFGIGKVASSDEAAELVARAQQAHDAKFRAWMSQYYDD